MEKYNLEVLGEKKVDEVYLRREGAYLLVIENSRALVVRNPKGYFLIGGGLEGEESQLECLKREALEETGYSIEVEKYLKSVDIYTIHSELGYFNPMQHYYLGRLSKYVASPMEEGYSLEWLEVDELDEMFLDVQRDIVKAYLGGLI